MIEKIPHPEINHFLKSGEHDPLFKKFSDDNHLDRIQKGHQSLMEALLHELRSRALTGTIPSLASVPCDVKSFARQKVDAMVQGLFKSSEREAIVSLLEKSLVFILPENVESVIQQENPQTAWEIANMYIRSIGAEPISEEAPDIVGLSRDTTCYVSMAYFATNCRFSDYVIHESAHVFHNSRRRDAGLTGIKEDLWLLPIDFRKRETFAYACEAYHCICKRGKTPSDRSSLVAELLQLAPPADSRVDKVDYYQLLTRAAARRNGWKVILEGCTKP